MHGRKNIKIQGYCISGMSVDNRIVISFGVTKNVTYFRWKLACHNGTAYLKITSCAVLNTTPWRLWEKDGIAPCIHNVNTSCGRVSQLHSTVPFNSLIYRFNNYGRPRGQWFLCKTENSLIFSVLNLTRSYTLKKVWENHKRRILLPQVWFLNIVNDMHSDFSSRI
jgi:hypothetical protein